MTGSYRYLRRLLFRLDPETAHHLTLGLLRLAGSLPPLRNALRRTLTYSNPSLRVRVFGLEFVNPIGLAAGYDKDGIALAGLACLGFGHLEVGTVTPDPQKGNPRPRVFRLESDEALINRMGFPNRGAKALQRRLSRRKSGEVILGVNLAKGADTPLERAEGDYLALLQTFHGLADYLVLNLSSPNTPGLRRLQDRPILTRLLGLLGNEREKLNAASRRRVPVLVKLSPDLESRPLQAAVEAIVEAGVEGVVASNTTLARESLHSPYGGQAGGLSGKPLRAQSTELVRRIRSVASGLPIIASGGVADGRSAQEKLEAGAALVQVFTGLIYEGPGLVPQILRHLAADPGETWSSPQAGAASR